MEEQYLQIAKRYAEGDKGQRGIDRMADVFGTLVTLMDKTRADILGDLFEGGITYGEHGQFLTPEHVATLMAQLTGGEGAEGTRVNDVCCGSGRLLLAAATVNRHRTFIGQDIDLRCVRMTAINLALRNLYGYVIWGNSLRIEQRLTYQTGFDGTGVIREVLVETTSSGSVAEAEPVTAEPLVQATKPSRLPKGRNEHPTLFDLEG